MQFTPTSTPATQLPSCMRLGYRLTERESQDSGDENGRGHWMMLYSASTDTFYVKKHKTNRGHFQRILQTHRELFPDSIQIYYRHSIRYMSIIDSQFQRVIDDGLLVAISSREGRYQLHESATSTQLLNGLRRHLTAGRGLRCSAAINPGP